MGDRNQLKYIQGHRDEMVGPYLEVGSRNYGTTQDLRAVAGPGAEYVGLDMSEGDGVDLVLDLTGDFDEIDRALGGRRFGTVFCLSVLEHCENPFAMAGNMTRLLAPAGRLFVSVPFAWKFHGYPCDYWRFTHRGVMKLFGQLEFDLDEAIVSTGRDGDVSPVDEDLARIHRGAKGGRLRSLAWKIGMLKCLLGHRYVMPPTLITMIGRRPGSPDR